jgi:gluconolactonase
VSPRYLALWLSCLIASPALAAPPVAIDADAHYPEGPMWRDGALLFVEYSTGNIKRWDGANSTVYRHLDPCGASGLIDFHGHLLVACYDDNSIVELDAKGEEVRRIRKDDRGKAFAGPNDFCSDGRGGVFFSSSGVYDVKAPINGSLLHLSADGKRVTEVAATIHYPNGLTVSRDGKSLLVAEMLAARILSFAIEPSGALGARTVWARMQDLAPTSGSEDAYNGPDGFKLGPDGNYYIAQNGSGRVLVVSEDKKLVRTIDVPTPFVTNVGFGAPGSGVVFVTGAFDQFKPPYPGTVYRWQP